MTFFKITKQGAYCPTGKFFIDPMGPADNAIITHGHADHARVGAKRYFCHKYSDAILKKRLGEDCNITALEYSEEYDLNGVKFSLHPAGHVLGSAQVRITTPFGIYVFSGDYKLAPDPTCAPFEHLTCDYFITESTFAMPIFRWAANDKIFSQITNWWRNNQKNKQPSVIGAYSLGKAQRILMSVENIGDIYLHGAAFNLMPAYEAASLKFPSYKNVLAEEDADFSQALIIAPPGAMHSSWGKRFKNANFGLASGWMNVRGNKNRRGVQAGFVLSDHADWPSLLKAVTLSQCKKVYTHHGYGDTLAKYLLSKNIAAQCLAVDQEI